MAKKLNYGQFTDEETPEGDSGSFDELMIIHPHENEGNNDDYNYPTPKEEL